MVEFTSRSSSPRKSMPVRIVNSYSSLSLWSKLLILLGGMTWILLMVIINFNVERGFIDYLTMGSSLFIPCIIGTYLICYSFEYINKEFPHNSNLYKYLGIKGSIMRLDYFISTLILESILFAITGGCLFVFLFVVGASTFTIFSLSDFNSFSFFIWNYITGVVCWAIITVWLMAIILCLCSVFVLTLKRISDIGKSRWLSLMLFVPGVNFIFQIALYFIPSAKNVEAWTNKGIKPKIEPKKTKPHEETVQEKINYINQSLDNLTCPKCRNKIERGQKECTNCGIIFEKYKNFILKT